uniref:Spiggin B alternatively spliced variant 1 n=1 Tax=Gasterosteus aculeatus TaxID=69293 RepID=A0A0H5BJG6_GASAC|nr:spiggin B alternatively spliced variant 1 [Gasterosteus aculeatus]
MTTQRWILAFCLSLASVFGTVELFKTKEIQTYTCRTFGSGIVQPFKGKSYYVRSDCPFKLTSFNVNPITNRREEKTFTYKHITSCECRLCNTQH